MLRIWFVPGFLEVRSVSNSEKSSLTVPFKLLKRSKDVLPVQNNKTALSLTHLQLHHTADPPGSNSWPTPVTKKPPQVPGQQLGVLLLCAECHRIVLSDSMEQLNQSSLLLDQCRAHLSMLGFGWLSVCIRDKQILLWKERTEMDLQAQLSSVNQLSRKTPAVMISFLLPKWKGGGMPEQRLCRWQSPVSWSTSTHPELAINETSPIPNVDTLLPQIGGTKTTPKWSAITLLNCFKVCVGIFN